jgi:hypothetical protein
MAFKLGKFVFVSAKVYISPALNSEGFYILRKSIGQKIKTLLPETEVRVYLKEGVIKEIPKRALIPICETSNNPLRSFITEEITKAGHYYIVDLMGERIITVKKFKNDFKNIKDLAHFIKNKRINDIYMVNENKELKKILPDIKIIKTNFLIFQDLFH